MVNAKFKVNRYSIEVTKGAMNLVEITIDEISRKYWQKIADDVHRNKDVTISSQILQESAEYISVFLYALDGDWGWRHIGTLEYVSKELLPNFSYEKPDTFYYLEYVGEKTKDAFFNACNALGYGGFVVFIPMYGWIITAPRDREYQILEGFSSVFRDGSYFD